MYETGLKIIWLLDQRIKLIIKFSKLNAVDTKHLNNNSKPHLNIGHTLTNNDDNFNPI